MTPEEIKAKKFWAGAILYHPEKKALLMQHRDAFAPVHPNQWALFGGVGERGENPDDCLIRELREEIGMIMKKEDFTPLHDYLIAHLEMWRFVYWANCTLAKEQMTLGEGADFDWVPVDVVLSYDMAEATKRDIIFFLDQVSLKKNDTQTMRFKIFS